MLTDLVVLQSHGSSWDVVAMNGREKLL